MSLEKKIGDEKTMGVGKKLRNALIGLVGLGAVGAANAQNFDVDAYNNVSTQEYVQHIEEEFGSRYELRGWAERDGIPPALRFTKGEIVTSYGRIQNPQRSYNPEDGWTIDIAKRYLEREAPAEVYLTEPGYWYLTEISNYISPKSGAKRELERENPMLNYFVEGMQNYYHRYKHHSYTSNAYMPRTYEVYAEENLVKAMLVAAGREANDFEGYRELSQDEQRQFINALGQQVQEQPFPKQKVFQWSISYYGNLLYNESNRDFSLFLFDIEKNLRNRTRDETGLDLLNIRTGMEF